MDCGQIIAATRDIVVVLAAIATATIAGFGLSTWKRELKGKADFELGRNLLKSVFNTRTLVSRTRWVGTGRENYPVHLEALNEERSRLFTLSQEAEALWSAEIRHAVLDLNIVVNELVWAISWFINPIPPEGEDMKKVRKIIFEFDEPDEFSAKLEEKITITEDLVRAHLKRR